MIILKFNLVMHFEYLGGIVRYVRRLDTWTLGAQKGLLNMSVHGLISAISTQRAY